jgi:diguanylate cyclase (GGDEF)-like protein
MFAKIAKFPAETRLLLLTTSTGALVALCFSIVRVMKGDMTIAAIDFYFSIGIMAGTWHIFKTGKHRKASVFLITLSYTAIIPIIYFAGSGEATWIFPVMVVAFFMLKPAEGFALNTLALLICIPRFVTLWGFTDLLFYLAPMIVMNTFCFTFAKIIWIQKNQLTELAVKDPLTGVGNRRALSEHIDRLLGLHKRRASTDSLIAFDIDHFKSINDTYGHLAGDKVLIAITEIICGRIRSTDSLYRQGGEEFIIVAINTTRDTAAKLAEELRQLIENTHFDPGRKITISFGVAELHGDESHQDWVSRADKALYDAKQSGRNTVCVS